MHALSLSDRETESQSLSKVGLRAHVTCSHLKQTTRESHPRSPEPPLQQDTTVL